MAKRTGGPEELLQTQLQELLDAEKQLIRALPKMAKNANDEELEQQLQRHLEVTRNQAERLSRVFESLGMRPRSKPCKGMKGIVDEGSELISQGFQGDTLDAAITSAARKVEHYEMAGYEGARAVAQQLGRNEVVQMLAETLREEIEADRVLAQIAKRLSRMKPVRMEERQPAPEERRRATGQRRAAGGRNRASAQRTQAAGKSAHPLTDHDEIQRWAEERDAAPACVKGTGGGGDVGMIRLDFPGYSGTESLQHISWDDWFQKFDESELALMVQEKTARGQQSNFNKLVKRTTAERRPRARAAR